MQGFERAQAEYESRMCDPYADEDYNPEDAWLDRDEYMTEQAKYAEMDENETDDYLWSN